MNSFRLLRLKGTAFRKIIPVRVASICSMLLRHDLQYTAKIGYLMVGIDDDFHRIFLKPGVFHQEKSKWA
jgi:hypothetical protein